MDLTPVSSITIHPSGRGTSSDDQNAQSLRLQGYAQLSMWAEFMESVGRFARWAAQNQLVTISRLFVDKIQQQGPAVIRCTSTTVSLITNPSILPREVKQFSPSWHPGPVFLPPHIPSPLPSSSSLPAQPRPPLLLIFYTVCSNLLSPPLLPQLLLERLSVGGTFVFPLSLHRSSDLLIIFRIHGFLAAKSPC